MGSRSVDVIDLCNDSSPPRKRRRAGDGDNSNSDTGSEDCSLAFARHLQNEYSQADREADERLARRLQRQEDTRSPPLCSAPWMSDIIGSHQRAGHAVHPNLPSRRALPSGRAGQLTRLALMDRDFGEADYEMLLLLDEVAGSEKRRAARANTKRIELLPTRKLTRAEARSEQVCAICLENMRAQQMVLTLPCKHQYHKHCIVRWLKNSESPGCPTCKAPALVPRGGDTPRNPSPHSEEEWHHT